MAYILTSFSPTKALGVDEVGGGITYLGFCKPGTPTDEAKWQIRKIVKVGTETLFKFADGNERYDNIWDNRASLTYLPA